MRPDVARDFQFGRQFLPHMREIVGQHLVAEAPFEEDTQRATDLIVLRLDAVRIACRVRRHTWLTRYGHEFTIRKSRTTGETELGKVLSGWGDYIIYGFAPEGDEGPQLAHWVLGDLRVFRAWFVREAVQLPVGVLPGGNVQANGDGSSDFIPFAISSLPDEFVVASNHEMAVA